MDREKACKQQAYGGDAPPLQKDNCDTHSAEAVCSQQSTSVRRLETCKNGEPARVETPDHWDNDAPDNEHQILLIEDVGNCGRAGVCPGVDGGEAIDDERDCKSKGGHNHASHPRLQWRSRLIALMAANG